MDQKESNIIVLKESQVTKSSIYVNKEEIRKYLDKDQIVDIINNISNHKDKMLMLTMWMTGLRVSEIIQIKKCDIDFKNCMLKAKHLKSRKFLERIIPIKKELKQMLEFYVVNMKWDELLFSFTRQWVYKKVKRYFNESPHCLRHSFAVNFLRQSTSPTALVILQKLLGHSKIQTTMEYLRIVPMDMAIELEKVKFN